MIIDDCDFTVPVDIGVKYDNYFVSPDGFMYSRYTLGGRGSIGSLRLVSGYPDKDGYLRVCLSKSGKTKTIMLHRVVAMTFLPNPNNKPCIDHIDGDKTNNSICNLRWVTIAENNRNPITNKRQSIAASGSNSYLYGMTGVLNRFSKQVLMFDMNMSLVNEFESVSSAVLKTGFCKPCISKACRGIRDSYKGFIWKFKRDMP